MRYNNLKTRPDKDSTNFFIKHEYVDQYTILNVYENDKIVGQFRTLQGLIHYMESDILDEWSVRSPELLDKYIGSDFEEYIGLTFKNYIRNLTRKFHGFTILFEYREKYLKELNALDKQTKKNRTYHKRKVGQ